MFKVSRLLKQNNLKILNSTILNRTYYFQTEIYNNEKVESRRVNNQFNENLRKENEYFYEKAKQEPNLYRFIKAYRQYGFKIGEINPLKLENITNLPQELDPLQYGLDRSQIYSTTGLLFNSNTEESQSLNDIENSLREIYSKNITIEFDHISNEEEKFWIAKEFEIMSNKQLESNSRVEILKLLLKSQAFDQFLAKRFPSFKRYSLEGGESVMAFYQSLFSSAASSDIEELVMGIAHRGRLNLMVLFLNLSPQLLFTKIKGKKEFSSDVKTATGDISHHFPCSTDLIYNSKKIHLNLLPNPSHLEAVDPVVLGKARSKQMFLKDGFYSDDPSILTKKVMSLLIHGDAAFAGQGIVTETFQLAKLPNYSVGGTVHLLVNNQIGFTNPSHLGGSGKYNTDLTKGFDCPIIHVNGDNPELAYKAAEFATSYRNLFGKDIVVDLTCFRRWGHNELDDPTFTQSQMYKIIHSRKSVPDMYQENIVTNEGLCTKDEIDDEISKYRQSLEDALTEVNNNLYKIEPRNTYLTKQWSTMTIASNTERSYWSTGCNLDLLKFVGIKSITVPDGFKVHPTIDRAHIKRRLESIKDGSRIDWSTAESLAFGSLLSQGFNIRISGQDVGRGTFSQRHCLLVDQESNKTYIPLNNIDESQKNFLEVCNSHLSEEAVMGFDYGFSMDHPNNLVIWEAQFGDFFNGAQIILDTYVSTSEIKWMHQSGIVLLLPHGFDGAGPEHTSSRIERFLQSCSSKEDAIDSDDINYYITHPTTPANYFHLLRRQMIQPYRKPLIVASPKILIRLPECVSDLNDMGPNALFKPVLPDTSVISKDAIRRVIFVFGKHYYALAAEKANRKADDVAIIRIEEICPFPAFEIRDILKEFKNAKEFIWAQEEHRNMGAWSFIKPRFENIIGIILNYAGRDVSCVPAVGIGELHSQEVKHVLSKPFEKL